VSEFDNYLASRSLIQNPRQRRSPEELKKERAENLEARIDRVRSRLQALDNNPNSHTGVLRARRVKLEQLLDELESEEMRLAEQDPGGIVGSVAGADPGDPPPEYDPLDYCRECETCGAVLDREAHFDSGGFCARCLTDLRQRGVITY
jgi:hypothetical protein